MQILEVKNLKVAIDKDVVLEDINFEVEQGESLAIIGPNGAGKTTLFKALLGFLPHQGEIKWAPNIKIGYVPQRIEVEKTIPLTVEEFLKLRSEKISSERIREILANIRLEEKILKAGLGEISAGQRQRLFIGWALLENPDIILFDEPTADVDIYGQESIYQTLESLQKEFKLSAILISHDLHIVYQYADKVMCLNHKNICFGEPEKILTPETIKKVFGSEKGIYQHRH